MSEPDANATRRAYWSEQLDAAYRVIFEAILPYPVAECGEPLVSLQHAAEAADLSTVSRRQHHARWPASGVQGRHHEDPRIDPVPVVPVVPVALQNLWGSYFSRIEEGQAMVRPFRRGLFSRVGLGIGAPIDAAQVMPALLQQRVGELLDVPRLPGTHRVSV
jgi:hypothetical protein